jgi:hypothetical protein
LDIGRVRVTSAARADFQSLRTRTEDEEKERRKMRRPINFPRWILLAAATGTSIFFMLMATAVPAAGFVDQVQVGAHGGLSIPNIRDGDNVFSRGYTSRKGPFIGLFAEFRFHSNFFLRTEVNYSSQGGKWNGRQPVIIDLPGLVLPQDMILYADFNNESILDYLEVPVLAGLTWGEKPRFFINAGPYIGFLIRAKTITGGMSTLYLDDVGTPLVVPPDYQPLPPFSFDATTDSKDDINDLSAGIAGGVGLAVPAGPGELIFGVRFSLGLTNIQADVETYGKNHTGAVVITIGYAYTVKKSR